MLNFAPLHSRLPPWLLRLLWGRSPEPSEYRLVSWLFVRGLALIYLIAFVSLAGQVAGLVGPDGILPLAARLDEARAQWGAVAYWRYPILFWFGAGDGMLQGACWAGAALAVLLLLDIRPRTCLILMFWLYLSLLKAGQVFLFFQWDYLLLEAGFLAIFLPGGARVVVWLFRWLLFRFRFLSGAMKLMSGDPSWASLTALFYYFETQPLPHTGSWYAHQLPHGLLMFGAAATLVIEILVPFMMFLPRNPRLLAGWATIFLQVLILLTSNHNFFNLLTITLCLFLFDDRALRRVLPAGLERLILRRQAPPSGRLAKGLLGTLAGLILMVSAVQMWEMFSGRSATGPLAAVVDQVERWQVVNKYGVFAVMNTQRIELEVEGLGEDGQWRPYVFKYKPGDPMRRPQVVIPHQPRLDWAMWFVPLGHPLHREWFAAFLNRLYEGAPEVTALLETNPYPNGPPKAVRASLYRYRFTDPATRAATGRWWDREYLGPYWPDL